jgi:predicted secreted hydrolase
MQKNIKPIEFPRDHGAHNNIIEWWYFNGHLWDQGGRHYSFMDCLFKADLKKVKIPFLKRIPAQYVYFAHSAVSDIKAQKSHKEIQDISLVSRDSFTRPLFYVNYIDPIIIRGYSNCEIAQTASEKFHIKTEKIDLTLETKKPPLLEGGQGHIAVCGRESYYYSLTDMSARGVIDVKGKLIEVSGKTWLDHQWADVAYSKDKWNWFSLQLNNGVDMMCVEYSDGKIKDYLADIIYPDGRQEHFKNLILTPGKHTWKSKKTKAEYPQSWTITIPEKNMRLETRSLMPGQEMIFGAINYWEGPLEVKAEINGEKISGVGFMELVGYESDYNYLLLAGKELRNQIQRKIRTSGRKIFKKIGWK